MPQSLSFMLIHLIFSTKNREPFIDQVVRSDLHAYMASVVRKLDCECYTVGGPFDHVHLAVRLARTANTAHLIQELKTSSSKWMKAKASTYAGFGWQSGYGAFSVGPADLGALRHYIENQVEHHRVKTFQEEYRAFLNKYQITYDEKYVWD